MILEILIFGLILSADSFSAAIAMGHRPFTKKDALKFAFTSGSAETFTTLIGSIAGAQIVRKFGDYDHWIAFFLLLGVALHMAYEGIIEMRGERNGVTDRHIDVNRTDVCLKRLRAGHSKTK
jgi:putative Mn2+ efflux pump MntP